MKKRLPAYTWLKTLTVASALSYTLLPAMAASKPTYAHKMEIGQLLYFNGDIDRAINAFKAAGELNPKAFEPHLNLVNLYIQKGSPDGIDRAAEECKEVLQRKPANREVHLILGNILRTQAGTITDPEAAKAKLAEAMKEVAQAEELGAPEAMCENTIGLCKLQMGDNEGALQHIDAAIKKQNNFPDAHLIRGVLLFKAATAPKPDAKPPAEGAAPPALDVKSPEMKKKLDEVFEALDTAITQKNGVNAEAVNTKADILFALGRFDEALEAYKKAAAQETRYAQAWAGLGNCAAQLANTAPEDKKHEHISAAKDAYAKAKKLKPTDKNIIYGLAVMLEKQGQIQEAIEEFNEGLQLETDTNMHNQIQNHVNQLRGATGLGGFGNSFGAGIGTIGGSASAAGGAGLGNNMFTSGALSQPFKDLIKIKAPPGHEGETRKEQ